MPDYNIPDKLRASAGVVGGGVIDENVKMIPEKTKGGNKVHRSNKKGKITKVKTNMTSSKKRNKVSTIIIGTLDCSYLFFNAGF